MPSIRRSGNWLLAAACSAAVAAVAACSGAEPTQVNKTVDPPASDWVTKAPMPTRRFIAGSAVVNGQFYVVGGRNNTNAGSSSLAATVLQAYDPASDSWTTLAPMPTPREEVGAGSVNGILYAIGGWGLDETNDTTIDCCRLNRVEAYDPSSNSWTRKAPLPIRRYDVGVGVVNGILYAIGGLSADHIESRVDAYDPSTDSWTTVAPMPHGRNGTGVGVVNGVIYVIGGLDSSGDLHRVEAYDPVTDTWSSKAPMPTARYGLAVGEVNGILYAVGGTSLENYGMFMTTVEAYDPATDTWSAKPPMSLARYFLNVAGIGSHLYAAGGGTTSVTNGHDTLFGLLEEYSP
jgi:N-acetylneuraminic acid mutarotase